MIAAIDPLAALPGDDEPAGDLVLPGLVELHTDHLESHFVPRPGVLWNAGAAVHAHDAQIATAGITTVLDALRVGTDEDARFAAADVRMLADALADAGRAGTLRAEHFLHLRCEVAAADAIDDFALFDGDERVRLVSLMDHTPGQRQFTSLEAHRIYYQGKSGMSDAQYEAFVGRRRALAERWSAANRAAIAERCRALGIATASHDDATEDHVAEAVEDGVTIAEFPTTGAAAAASRAAGLKVLMGAPNVVRGRSHSGNIAAATLAEAGMLDILSSDYVPSSLLHAAVLLARTTMGLPQAIALVSDHPARAAGFADRGRIAVGCRADLIQVTVAAAPETAPVVRRVWRAGERVA